MLQLVLRASLVSALLLTHTSPLPSGVSVGPWTGTFARCVPEGDGIAIAELRLMAVMRNHSSRPVLRPRAVTAVVPLIAETVADGEAGRLEFSTSFQMVMSVEEEERLNREGFIPLPKGETARIEMTLPVVVRLSGKAAGSPPGSKRFVRVKFLWDNGLSKTKKDDFGRDGYVLQGADQTNWIAVSIPTAGECNR